MDNNTCNINIYIMPETIDKIIGENGWRVMKIAVDYNVKITINESYNNKCPFFNIESLDKNIENCHKVRIIFQKLEEYFISN